MSEQEWQQLCLLMLNGDATVAAAKVLRDMKVPLPRVQALIEAGVPASAVVDVVNYDVPERLFILAVGQHWSEWQLFAKAYFTVRDRLVDWHDVLGSNWNAINDLARQGVDLDVVRAVAEVSPRIAGELHIVIGTLRQHDLTLPAQEYADWIRAGVITVLGRQQVRVDKDRLRLWRNAFGVRGALYLAAGLSMTEAREAERDGTWSDSMLRAMAGLRTSS